MVRYAITAFDAAAHGSVAVFSWWEDVNDSPLWQDRIFHALALLYALVSAVALVQLVRIQLRVPEYGWTTQKVFHFLNFLVNGVRSVVFVFRRTIQYFNPEILQHVLLDVPSLAFFSTYALLVLFWAEIYYQARAVSTDGLRRNFFFINAAVYAVQVILLHWFFSSCESCLQNVVSLSTILSAKWAAHYQYNMMMIKGPAWLVLLYI